MVRLEDDDECRRDLIEPLPQVGGVLGRRERVEEGNLAAGLDAGRSDARFPVDA
jgi:hypothetical protein